jgi:ipoprotein LpqH
MKRSVIAAASCAAAIAVMTGCSSQSDKTAENTAAPSAGASATSTSGAPAETPAPADASVVKFGTNDAGPVTAVRCQTDGVVMTISIEAAQNTTVVLTDEATPAVKSVGIGEAGSDGPSLVFLEGVSAEPQATREDKKFTVSGSGMGTDAAGAANPVEMPFEIAVTCP